MTKEEFILTIGPWNIAIQTRFRELKHRLRAYLGQGQPDHTICISDEEFRQEEEAYRQRTKVCSCPDFFIEGLAIQRKLTALLFEHDTLLFHGSAVAVDGQTYLFIAQSGTGKSTHTALWRQLFGDRAVMVNDDKPFLAISNAGVQVIGSPWNGVHHQGSNITLPLKAICILERGQTNRIQKISFKESLFMLMQQSKCPGNRGQYMALIEKLSQVEFYRMQCNTQIEAAKIAFEAMSGGTV